MKHLIAILTLNAMLLRADANTYYVSPSGSDSNPGTISQPFASWQKLITTLQAGDTGYVRGGKYLPVRSLGSSDWQLVIQNKNGTASKQIYVLNYPGESPVWDFNGFNQSNNNTAMRFMQCSYIYFRGLRIINLLQNSSTGNIIEGWEFTDCTNMTLEACAVDNIGGAGFRQKTNCNNFTWINCDASKCGDPISTGGGNYGNADGFDINYGTATLTGCRAWWNSDDGFDCFYNDALVTFKNCWSFWNGYKPGTFTDPGSQADGTGFKWGITTTDQSSYIRRSYINCVAFQNKTFGFDQNQGKCKAEFYNNTSYNNKKGGWATGYSITPREQSILRNNISFSDPVTVSDMSGLVTDHNTWNSLAASTASFASLDTTGVTKARQSDGSLPSLQFLHLSAGSNLINAGVSITNLSFSGSAPDLGAFEYGSSSPTNQPPVANAGSSQVIVLPTSSAILDGSASSDADGTIKSYNWSEISGPSSATISTPTLVTTNVTTLVQGTYTFQLLVTDDKGATGTATVTITVNNNSNKSNGKKYYFSSTTGDDSRSSSQAQNSSTPWKSLDKLNSIFSTLQPGDVIYFNRGDIFYGSINPTTSGTSSGAIQFTAYGTGNKPIITGLADATGWRTVGTNIWESNTISSGQATAMIVAINGTSYPMGRWPNATDTWGGFRKISSHSGSTSIKDNSLTSTPNWTGATLVMRKNQYRMEKGTVTNHSGTTLTYSSTWNQTNVSDGYGYFIENSISTLDKQNEWYYNSSTKKLDIYSTSTPSNVKISTITTLINATSKSYLSFDNLNVQGSIGRMVVVSSSSHITFTNCDLSNAGADAFYGTNCSYLDVENCTITNSNHTAITLDQNASYAVIKNNTITSSAANPGMLDNYWLLSAVYLVGSNNTVEKNSVRKSGYLGIAFAGGNNISIKNNWVDSTAFVLDEGGAIYTNRGSDANVYSNRTIDGNIVTNVIGALNGKTSTQGAAAGIQMDGNSQGVSIINNSVANVSMYGILLLDAHEITINNNTVYNCVSGTVAMQHNSGWNLIRNVNFRNNKFVMATPNNSLGNWSYQTDNNDLLQFGTSDSNTVATPMNDVNAFFSYDGSSYKHQTLAQWQSYSSQDKHSKQSPKTITSLSSLRFEYNATSSNMTVSLGKSYIDIKGVSYPGSITLAPYTSAVLISTSGNTTQSTATAEIIDQNSLTEKPSFTIYPNPVRDNFVLQLNNSHMGKMDVQVVNQAGAIIRSYLFSKDQIVNQIAVPANDLPTGIYFVHVQIGTWSDERKIVKL